jgi:metal transporter CNNM
MITIVLLVLLAFSALFSGLTIGLMGLDVYTLRRKIKSGNKDALKVYEIRKEGTLLLTTLLFGNVAINAVVSIILGELLGGVLAGFIATGVIFIACEIVPQAVMSRHALRFGATFAGVVRFFMWVLYPICGPLAWILNRFLGHELHHHLSKKELISMIEEYEAHLPESAIDVDEQRIAKGSLMYSHKTVADVMTPTTVAIVAELSQVLDQSTIDLLKQSGLSRFPVYEDDRNNIIGILYWRDLVGVQLGTPVKDIYDPYVHFVSPEDKLDNVLNQFIQKRVHLFVVRDEFGSFLGVISLEDVLEQIVGAEIVDEDDKHADLRSVARTMADKNSKQK